MDDCINRCRFGFCNTWFIFMEKIEQIRSCFREKQIYVFYAKSIRVSSCNYCFVLTSKNLDGKQKGIIGGIAAVALVIAGITGTDFNPPSVEQYTEQTAQVEGLNNGVNHVFWTKSGKSFHLFQDCHTINKKATTEIFQGTVAQARELKNITDLCDFCERKAEKNKAAENILETPETEESTIEEEAAE